MFLMWLKVGVEVLLLADSLFKGGRTRTAGGLSGTRTGLVGVTSPTTSDSVRLLGD